MSLKEILLYPFTFPGSSSQRIFLPYLLAALVIALHAYAFRDEKLKNFTLKGFIQYCFPRSIYFHKSAIVDYAYFFVKQILFIGLFYPLMLGVKTIAASTTGTLEGILGSPAYLLPNNWLVVLIYTTASFLMMDLALYWAHYLQHKIPALWEFHKVHHSAEVLTPMTVYRMHPIDDLLGLLLVGSATGITTGFFNYACVSEINHFSIMGVHAFLFIYYLFGYNLRHSHIWISYGPFWSKILMSPAQHQLHHSKAPEHRDVNLGFVFSFWDLAMKTLCIPSKKVDITFGLSSNDESEFSDAIRLLILPFKKFFIRKPPIEGRN